MSLWRIPRTKEPGRLCSPWGLKESDTSEELPPPLICVHFFINSLLLRQDCLGVPSELFITTTSFLKQVRMCFSEVPFFPATSLL